MNNLQKKRIGLLLVFSSGIVLAVGLILFALKQNINVFLTPTQVTNNPPHGEYIFRLGGMVKQASVLHVPNSLTISFVVTDFHHDVPVQYTGVLPDLFHEGKGVIAQGKLNSQGTFVATQVLAKHDENYMPPTRKEIT